MWRNDTKCKYMFMFPVKNLARKGLRSGTMLSGSHYRFSHWLAATFWVPCCLDVYSINLRHCLIAGQGLMPLVIFSLNLEFHFVLIHNITRQSLQNLAHATAAMLSWHVQDFVAICLSIQKLQQIIICIKFELRLKNHKWNVPRARTE